MKSTEDRPQEDAGPISEVEGVVDLERMARDQIAEIIQREFTGHGLAVLVEALLRVQGYHTYRSQEGPDKGIDILAAPDSLGFGHPRICVQVKSGEAQVDRPTLDQLVGTMQNVHADQGLLVSWSGFKNSVEKERAGQFFRVRLWSSEEVVQNLLDHYERLPEEIRAALPLKRVWVVAADREDSE